MGKRAEKLGGIVDIDTSLKLNKPELRVKIDRARAADLGVDTSDISSSLRLMVGNDGSAAGDGLITVGGALGVTWATCGMWASPGSGRPL